MVLTLSLSGSQGRTPGQKAIRKGLCGVVKEYLQAPLVSTLPRPEFPMAGPLQSSSSVQLQEGMCQMSEVIAGMSETALLDQGSQGNPVKNT